VTSGRFRELVGRIFGGVVEPFLGRSELWGKHNKRRQTLLSVPGAIDVINTRWGVKAAVDCHRPIFILSAGWRSGSTLLQRLLVSNRDVLIWGEPYSPSNITGRLAESIRIFSETFPPPEFIFASHQANSDANWHEKWIAHLYPQPQDLREAHRAFFSTLFAMPAARHGYARWGFKECKYGIDHAVYLKWLFPRAKFFFVYRNPYHAYRSFRLFGAYRQWPDDAVFTAREFGELWKELMQGFLAGHAKVEGHLVKYEDLVSGRIAVQQLQAFAEVTCDPSILDKRVDGRENRHLAQLPDTEARMLALSVEPLASTLGYDFGSRNEEVA
jgi:hypothetical protein